MKNRKTMKVIMVTGAENAGKTTTINLAYCRLKSLGASEAEERTQVGENPLDFECILQYQDNSTIAFFSMGDEIGKIRAAIKTYKEKCDWLIIAVRDEHDKFDPVKGEIETEFGEDLHKIEICKIEEAPNKSEEIIRCLGVIQ